MVVALPKRLVVGRLGGTLLAAAVGGLLCTRVAHSSRWPARFLQGENNIGWPQSLSGYMPEYPSRATPDAETFAADLRAAEAQRAADIKKAARDIE